MEAPSAHDWYWIQNTDQLDSPALVVYPERVKANIKLAVEMAGDPVRLRPHIKTHKSPDVTKLMLEAGIQKFKCATIAEAEMLAMAGARDVLLAYQPVGPKLQRFIALARQYPGVQWSCLVDNEEALVAMGAAFAAAKLRMPVYLDLNIGMNRTGIATGAAAFQLYRAAADTEGVTPVGLHAYDGHIRDVDFEQRKQKCDEAFAGVTALKQALQKEGFDHITVVAGGSPTFSVHCNRPEVECSPGTFIYWDKGYSDGCPEQGFLPAALVISRVVSLPAAGRLCLDLGHKSIAAENELSRRVYFLNAPDWKPIGQSEEHMVMIAEAGEGHGHHPGDLVYGLPFHICPTVNLYERAFTIDGGQLTGEWRNTARDRKIGF
ncbi:MAG: threonine aldolase [Sphingobacteriales bacterium 50-39]|mgnify:CR=1 FL=1|nr:D-TA family PLP-dependent enzyme [Sphingobacteriales bacterium]OJW59477.1 MAG: threonine aldolase [Sphingobacteriales bacterium 50-39]